MATISKSLKELHSVELCSKDWHSKTDKNEGEIPKERYISLEKRQQIIDELSLV